MPEGAVFHARTKQRRIVALDQPLRVATEEAVTRLMNLLRSRAVPPAVLKPQCRGCSLHDHCLPEASRKPTRTATCFRAEFSDPAR